MAKKSNIPANALERYEKLVATHPDVERKGAAMPYTSLNGHMFSFLTPDGTLALRLPDEQREAFLKKYKTKLVEQHGRVMKEYVAVPPSLLKTTGELKKVFARSVAYIASLKPKATTRKKAAKGVGKKTVKKVAKKAPRKKR